ncbi:sugar kinase [Halobacteriales archaeon QS_9_70_65]|nr:MAG: sugar kinase [Halobacteriales archaeon QS_9_70_65]
MRAVCAGHVNWDVTLQVDRLPVPNDEDWVRERTEPGGGSAANVAALAGLDREARPFGSVGDDDAGSAIRSELWRAGVETRLRTVAGAATTRKYLLVDDDGEVAVPGTGGADESLSAADIPAATFDDADALHLTGQDPKTAAVLAATAADRGLAVSFDPGRRLTDRDYDDIDHVDLLFASKRETAAAATPAWTVTTRGGRGATLSCPEGRLDHPGYDLDGPPVDAAGAGDAFAAGFLAVRLADGDPERALSVAAACGALAAGERGPRPDLPWERVERVVS